MVVVLGVWGLTTERLPLGVKKGDRQICGIDWFAEKVSLRVVATQSFKCLPLLFGLYALRDDFQIESMGHRNEQVLEPEEWTDRGSLPCCRGRCNFHGDRTRYLAALSRADSGDDGLLGDLVARADIDNLYWFIVPAVAGPARLVPLTALATRKVTAEALRIAAIRGRLKAQREPTVGGEAPRNG